MAADALRGGIDLGGTKIQAIVADPDHQVLGQARRQTPTEGGPPDVVAAMAEALDEAAQSAGVDPATLSGIGVGAPGAADEATGSLAQAGNLPGWSDPYPLAAQLSARFEVAKVRLGNDVQVATDAEFNLGAAREFSSVLGVFWGTGVGGGIVLDGQPWLGRGAAGEIGHIPVHHHGLKCPCGRHGCMEAYAGRRAMELRARKAHDDGEHTDLFKIMEEKGRDRLTSGIWSRAIERGDKLAERLIDEAIDALGIGVASACNVLDPDAVIIGGGLGVRFGEPYAQRISDAMMPHLFHDDDPPVMRVAELGDLGGALGAALLVVWSSDLEAMKRAAAIAAAQEVEDGMRLGLGTGSTVAHLLPAIAARGLSGLRCVATSVATEQAAAALGIAVEPFDALSRLDLAIDGADQIAPDGWIVKGGGGAHTREKIVAAAAGRFVVIADASKVVDALRAPVPLELLAFGLEATLAAVGSIGPVAARPGLPPSPDGGIIADYAGDVGDPAALAAWLSATPGVVDHGLFPPALTSEVIVAGPDGVQRRALA